MKIRRHAVACALSTMWLLSATAVAQDQPLVADLRPGSCAAPSETISSLNAPAIQQGDPVGAGRGVTAATSASVAEVPYDAVLAMEHVLTISRGGAVVACGAVGGIQDADGSLAFVLAEQGESGITGVAVLAPTADPALTSVSLYLDPGAGAAGTADNPARIGTTLEGSGLQVTPLEASFADTYGASTPKGSFKYLVIDVEITNVDDGSHGYNSNRFSGYDMDTGAGYDSIDVAADGMLDGGDLDPGEYVTGTVVLEVQETSQRVRIKYDPTKLDWTELIWVFE